MVQDALDALEAKFPACQTVAFGDLTTRMILVTNAGSPHRREALEELCAEADLMLGNGSAVSLGDAPGDAAFVQTKDSLHIYLRAPEEPRDVLCCVCAPQIDSAAFLADARACLARISGGE